MIGLVTLLEEKELLEIALSPLSEDKMREMLSTRHEDLERNQPYWHLDLGQNMEFCYLA